MTGIPMKYQTTYQWQAKAVDGTIDIKGHAELPVGSPHDLDRYCPGTCWLLPPKHALPTM